MGTVGIHHHDRRAEIDTLHVGIVAHRQPRGEVERAALLVAPDEMRADHADLRRQLLRPRGGGAHSLADHEGGKKAEHPQDQGRQQPAQRQHQPAVGPRLAPDQGAGGRGTGAGERGCGQG